MISSEKSQIVCSTGISMVVDAFNSMDELWENHFALLKNMISEMAMLKESGSSKPLTTPVKVTGISKKPRLVPKLPPVDTGRVTRSMVKRIGHQSDSRVSQSSSGSELSARHIRKGIKEKLDRDSELRDEACLKNDKSKGRVKVKIESVQDGISNCYLDKGDFNLKTKKIPVKFEQQNSLCPPNEWLTDDEDDSFKSPLVQDKSSGKKTTAKKTRKRKSTQYFTPSCPAKSIRRTRAAARAEAQLTGSASKAKYPAVQLSNSSKKSPRKPPILSKAISSSGSSITPQTNSYPKKPPSITSGSRAASRGTTPDTKTLTDSAAKRRKEEEEKRRLQWEQLIQKEQKALLQKQENLKQRQLSSKLKNEERKKKIEKAKEKKEKEMEEKKMKEQEKLEDLERRRKEKEEARRLEALRHQEMLKKRQKENDLRKQEEEEDRLKKRRLQEQIFRQKQEEIERKRKEENEVFKLIREHNAAIKGPVPKYQANGLLKEEKGIKELSETNELVTNETFTYKKANVDDDNQLEKNFESNTDFKVPSAQHITPQSLKSPPHRTRSLENYDITDIKSDDGTDDDELPKKPIPSWAKSENFVMALDQQYSVGMKKREHRIREIFGKIELPIDLGDIFKGSKACNPRYEKRTSSAVWNSPVNMSFLNYSMLSEK